jgi:hypothetical protein
MRKTKPEPKGEKKRHPPGTHRERKEKKRKERKGKEKKGKSSKQSGRIKGVEVTSLFFFLITGNPHTPPPSSNSAHSQPLESTYR